MFQCDSFLELFFFNPWRSERYTNSGGLAGECPPRRLEGWSGPFHYSSGLVLLYVYNLGNLILLPCFSGWAVVWWCAADHASDAMVVKLMQNRLDFGLAMYHKSSTAVHWLQSTRDENCFLGLQWLYLKSRILISSFCLCCGLSWKLQYKGAECLGQHVSKNTQAKFMLLLLLGGLGISSAFPVGTQEEVSFISEHPSIHASKHEAQCKGHWRQGEIFTCSDGLRTYLMAVWKQLSSCLA